jgi:hypothetical protein
VCSQIGNEAGHCVDGWSGRTCDVDVNECASDPCVNGRCIQDIIDHWTCHCYPGWNAHHCDEDIDECASVPCQNHAACTNLHDAYDCDCRAGYAGFDCEVDIDECSSSPCVNGSCEESKNSTLIQPGYFVCECEEGFEGVLCGTEILDLKDLIDHRPAIDMCRSEVLLFMSFNNDAARNPITIALGAVTSIVAHVLGVNFFMVLSTELSERSEYDIDTAQTIVRVSIVVALGGLLAFITDRAQLKDGRRKRKLLFGLNLAVVVFTLFSQLPLATNWVSKGLNVPEESVLIIALVMHQLITWMLCVCVWSSKQMVISICVLCMVLLSTMETFVDVTVALLGKPLEWQRTLLVFEAMQDVLRSPFWLL